MAKTKLTGKKIKLILECHVTGEIPFYCGQRGLIHQATNIVLHGVYIFHT